MFRRQQANTMCCSLGTSGPNPKERKGNGVKQVMCVEVHQKSDERGDCGNKVVALAKDVAFRAVEHTETQRWSSCSKTKHNRTKARLKKMLQS